MYVVYNTNFHCNALTAMKIIETSILRPLLPNKLVGQEPFKISKGNMYFPTFRS
jgi:hypothetical protein